ncbi:MAG: hypothetical protein Q7R49_00290 [Candidatus Daviesbacteria bacterium]|nr:hypothetical protein [Candidatus Daviesbacteria bacterium]
MGKFSLKNWFINFCLRGIEINNIVITDLWAKKMRIGVNTVSIGENIDAGVATLSNVIISSPTISGALSMTGSGRTYKHIAIPLTGIGQGATAPTLTRYGNTYGYAFAINDDGYIQFEVPHDWDSSTVLTIGFHYYNPEAYATNSGEVRFTATWSAISQDGSEAVGAATHTGTLDSGDINLEDVAYDHKHMAFGTIAAASLAAGDTVYILLKRVALVAGNNPTAGKPTITLVDCTYTSNSLGTAV